jgi:hypothetical protein
MKVTETQPGGEIKEYVINLKHLKQGKTVPSFTFSPDNDEPIAVRILESSWPGLYHVLVEFGDYSQTDYHHLSAEQILEKYGIDLVTCVQAVVIDQAQAKKIDDPKELGSYVQGSLFPF